MIGLDSRTIKEIAKQVLLGMKIEIAEQVRKAMDKREEDMKLANDDLITTKEAAAILGVTVQTMQRTAYRYPHVRSETGNHRILFFKSRLLEGYQGVSVEVR